MNREQLKNRIKEVSDRAYIIIHFNELKIISINIYTAIVSVAYFFLCMESGRKNSCILLWVLECIFLILIFACISKRKRKSVVLFISLFITNIFINFFYVYALYFTVPLSLIGSCLYKIYALKTLEMKTVKDKSYREKTYLLIIPIELAFAILMIFVTWRIAFNFLDKIY